MNTNLPLIESGILSVGVDASAPLPLHSDPSLPDFKGFEVDLMKSVAARVGVSVRYRNALWSKIMDDLLEGRVDMICSAATITEQRKELVDFSQPYLDIRLAIVVRNGSSIKTLADMRDRIVGVRIATSGEDFLRRHAQAKAISTFDMNTEAYQTLQMGKVDAVIDDSPIAQAFATSTPGLQLARTIPGTDAQYAMMFRKGNDELRRVINDALTTIKADGTYADIHRKWLEASETPVPGFTYIP
jgi:ABC-type amino acid transport substrate-binding protein